MGFQSHMRFPAFIVVNFHCCLQSSLWNAQILAIEACVIGRSGSISPCSKLASYLSDDEAVYRE